MLFKNKILKTNVNITKKQILNRVIILIMIFILIIGIYIYMNRGDKVKLEENLQQYIVTEHFIENSDDSSKIYEVRYHTRKRKSYLVLVEKNGVEKDETVTEIKNEFTNESVSFTIDTSLNSMVKDLAQYADDSGFIYTCKIDDIQGFLTNEAMNGKIKIAYATPSYFECFIENNEGYVMRGLLLYNSDLTTGTLIYKQCNEDIIIPNVMDIVTSIEGSEKQ